MCLHIAALTLSTPSMPEPLVAEQDIKIFKVLWNDSTSPYMDYLYTADTTYHVDGMHPTLYTNPRDYSQYIVTIGLHAYRTLEEANVNAYILYDGYHHGVAIVEMTIPKGAHYFLGTGNSIVSDTLASGDMIPISSERINWINHMQTADIAG